MLANDNDTGARALAVTAATLADPAQAPVVINPDGTLGFVPAANFTGTVTINYTVSDASGANSVSTVTVSVGTNKPGGADVTRSLGGTAATLQPADLGFSDADAGPGQTLAGVRIDNLPAQRARCCSNNAGGGRHGGDGCAAGLRCAGSPAADGSGQLRPPPSAYGTAQARSTPARHLPLRRPRQPTMRRSLRVSTITVAEVSRSTRRWASWPRRISMAMR